MNALTINHHSLMPGFANPSEAQACFRAVLRAFSYPGEVVVLASGIVIPPENLSTASASVLLTILDPSVSVSLDAGQQARDWLVFHSGVRFREAAEADFVVAHTRPRLDSLFNGSDDEPEAGATLILEVSDFDAGSRFKLTGPGIENETIIHLPLDSEFAKEWRAQRRMAPRGVDVLLCAGRSVIGLPRSLTIEEV